MSIASSSRPIALIATLIALTTGVITLLAGPATSAATAEPPVSDVVLTAPPTGVKRGPATFTVSTSVAGVQVVLEGWTGTEWTPRAEGLTDQAGNTELNTTLGDDDVQRFRARAGTEPVYSEEVEVVATAQHGDITVDLAGSVNDGDSLPLSISWVSSTGVPIPGPVRVHRFQQGRWTVVAVLPLGPSGTATTTIVPRWDSTWYVSGEAGTWYDAARSADHVVDNIPPGMPVVYPADAPLPTVLVPPQPRATTPGASPVITRIPGTVWRSMVGRSWHRGCPIGRAKLRLLRINYWGFDGYRHQGQLVARVRTIRKFRAALVDLYNQGYPIRSMYLPDRFGYSRVLRGADDLASMAAGNTSAFNCRRVVHGRRLSPHSRGRSLDINPWENPYISAKGPVPNTWWPTRSWAPITARSHTDLLVRVLARHGVRWTYGRLDPQHFDG